MYSQACISINKTRNGVISEKQINKWKDAFSKYILNLVLSSVSFSRSFFSAGIRRRNSYVHSFLGIGLGLGFPFSLSHTHTHTPIHIVSFDFRSSFAMPQIQYSEKYFDDVYEYRCVHQKFSPSLSAWSVFCIFLGIIWYRDDLYEYMYSFPATFLLSISVSSCFVLSNFSYLFSYFRRRIRVHVCFS